MSIIACFVYYNSSNRNTWSIKCDLIDCNKQNFYFLRLNAIGSSLNLITATIIIYIYLSYLLWKYKESTNSITEIINIHQLQILRQNQRKTVLNYRKQKCRQKQLSQNKYIPLINTPNTYPHSIRLDIVSSNPTSDSTFLSQNNPSLNSFELQPTNKSKDYKEESKYDEAYLSPDKINIFNTKESVTTDYIEYYGNISIEKTKECLIFHDTQQSNFIPFSFSKSKQIDLYPNSKTTAGQHSHFYQHRKFSINNTMSPHQSPLPIFSEKQNNANKLSINVVNDEDKNEINKRHSTLSTISANFPLHLYACYVLVYCLVLTLLYFIIFVINICLSETIDKYFEVIYYILLISTTFLKYILKKIARKIDFYRTLDEYENNNTFEISLELFTEYLISTIYWLNYRGLLIYHQSAISFSMFLYTKSSHILSESWETIVRPSQFYYNVSGFMQNWLISKAGNKLNNIYDDSTDSQWRYRLSVDITIHFLVSILSGLFLLITLLIWKYFGIHLDFKGQNEDLDLSNSTIDNTTEYQFLYYLTITISVDLVYFIIIWIFWHLYWNINLFQIFVVVYEFNKKRMIIGCVAVFCVTRYVLRIAQNTITFQQHT
eukprot:10333_1